jgi:carbonic anhydrase
MKRSQFVSCLIAVSLGSGSQFARAADPAHPDQPSVAPTEAISKLKEGNGRYASGSLQHPGQTTERRTELAKTQHPFATIISCSDSRVPPEIVFDQGLGDLFIVRVAGNVINDEGLGSIEYSVDHLGTRLILVLGHQSCGAVKAARETIAAKGKAPGHIQSLVTAIKPAVEATAKLSADGSGCYANLFYQRIEEMHERLEGLIATIDRAGRLRVPVAEAAAAVWAAAHGVTTLAIAGFIGREAPAVRHVRDALVAEVTKPAPRAARGGAR